jgi:hypothetical protein
MKNSIKILITVLILIILGGSFYIYKIKKDGNTEPFVPIVSTNLPNKNKSLTDKEFTKTSEDPEAKILARGDLNNDGFEDAIVAETFCGASCSVNLAVILNKDNKTTSAVENNRFEGYTAGTALQSDVQEIKIEGGTISITGRGLDCGYTCNEEKWNVIKTLRYELIEDNITRISDN